MKSLPSPSRDCAGLAPQLTALFDDEADEIQAQQARAHLLICSDCSRAWLNWTQYRTTLQSETVPAPPPTFLWRLLIAYRVAAFAHPARYPESSPVLTAHDLRDLEAPLPPRLSQHILAQTTRKPSAHVMLTPLTGPALQTSARQKARSAKFRRFPLMAVPALALWILTLGRTDLIATLPALPSDATLSLAPSINGNDNLEKKSANPVQFVPIPVLPVAIATREKSPRFPDEPRFVGSSARDEIQGNQRVRPNTTNRPAAVAARSRPTSGVGSSNETLNRALLLAMNASRTDLARAQSQTAAPIAIRVAAPVAPILVAEKLPTAAPARELRPINLRSAPRASNVSESPTGFVGLAALTSPIGPVRTFTNARLRTAVFSEESAVRPRVSYARADGRRLARLSSGEGEVSLRVSRPNLGAPTLRPSNYAGDSGPRIEDLRSAVDDFRASVAGEQFGE